MTITSDEKQTISRSRYKNKDLIISIFTVITYFQIIATDLDSDKNGEVSYSIIRGDNLNQFDVDEKTGYVSVAGDLDRETISSYVLEILAKDNGVPVLSRQTLLNIEISDANDNPPLFSQTNYTAVIQVIHAFTYNNHSLLYINVVAGG